MREDRITESVSQHATEQIMKSMKQPCYKEQKIQSFVLRDRVD